MVEDEPIRLLIDEDVWLGLAAALRERGKVHYGILVVDQLPRGELLRRVEAFLRQHQAMQVKNRVWFL